MQHDVRPNGAAARGPLDRRGTRGRALAGVLLPVVAVVLGAPLVTAAPAQAAITTSVVASQADARVEKSNASKNYGRATALTTDGSPVVETYVRFAPSGVTGTVLKAVLRLHTSNGSVDGPAVFPTAASWSETGITWNNRPARTGGALADVGAVSSGRWVEYDVTAAVRGDGTFSFVLASASADSTSFHSRESTSTSLRPQLVLTVDDGRTTASTPLDTTPPETTIASGPSGTTADASATFAFTSSEAGSTFSCRLDGGASTACASPVTYSALPVGPHSFEVQARDAAGNVDPSPAARAWTVAQLVSTTTVSPVVETDPVPHTGDAADDPAIWIDRQDRSRSTIIGTDKQGGLAVYDLAGRQLQYLPVGNVNNVDVRPDLGTGTSFVLGGTSVSLVTAGNRSNNSIGVYVVQPGTRELQDVAARTITSQISVYGSCMYRSPRTGKHYVFVDSKLGEVEQWELFDNGAGKVDAVKVRSFDVGTQTEGCVADDEMAHLYVGEESYGIWKYGAEPQDGATRTLVAATDAAGPLVSNVEGLALTYGPSGTGFLIASSQGDSSYTIYAREGANAFVKRVKVGAGGGVDGTEETDGIDVTTADLGPQFPHGVFVAQDGRNDSGNQNFKLIPYPALVGG